MPTSAPAPGWLADLDRAAADPHVAAAAGTIDATVEHQVLGPGGAVVDSWHLTVGGGEVHVAAGPVPGGEPTVTLTWSDADTAAGVRAGTVGAQAAFADGRLRVGGDVTALRALVDLATALDAARA